MHAAEDTMAKKTRGRPVTTGRGTGVLIKVHDPLLAAVDNWRKRKGGGLTRPEAFKRLAAIAIDLDPDLPPPLNVGAVGDPIFEVVPTEPSPGIGDYVAERFYDRDPPARPAPKPRRSK